MPRRKKERKKKYDDNDGRVFLYLFAKVLGVLAVGVVLDLTIFYFVRKEEETKEGKSK